MALLRGYRAREEARYRRIAWQTAHLLNVSGKIVRNRVTPDDLLGEAATPARPEPPSEPAPDAGLDFVAMLNAALGGTDRRT
jgi:hypothetical protein